MKRLIFYSLIAMLLTAARSSHEPQAPLQIIGFRLSSATPSTLAPWYSRNLDFDMEERNGATVLSKGSMTIELEKWEFSNLPVASGKRQPGFFKIGFKTPQPYFFSIIALDFEQTKAWVESNLGFTELHKLDLPARGFLIRLMIKDDLLLELISDDKVDTVSQPLPGIKGIVFNRSEGSKSSGELRYNGL